MEQVISMLIQMLPGYLSKHHIEKDLERLGIICEVSIMDKDQGVYRIYFNTQEDRNLYRMFGSIEEHYWIDIADGGPTYRWTGQR